MPVEPAARAVLERSPRVAAQRVCGYLVLVPLWADDDSLAGDCLLLNATGEAVWHLLDGSRDVVAIAGKIAARYGEDPTLVTGEVSALVERLAAAGFLVPVPGTMPS